MLKNHKNFIYFFATGLLTPLYLSSLSDSGHLSIVLSIDFTIAAFASLYLGKLSDKIGTQKLFYLFIPISIFSAFFLNFLVTQIIYGVSLSIPGLLINIETSKQKNTQGVNFGTLTFYIQLATALSILLGGFLLGSYALIIYTILLIYFLLLV